MLNKNHLFATFVIYFATKCILATDATSIEPNDVDTVRYGDLLEMHRQRNDCQYPYCLNYKLREYLNNPKIEKKTVFGVDESGYGRYKGDDLNLIENRNRDDVRVEDRFAAYRDYLENLENLNVNRMHADLDDVNYSFGIKKTESLVQNKIGTDTNTPNIITMPDATKMNADFDEPNYERDTSLDNSNLLQKRIADATRTSRIIVVQDYNCRCNATSKSYDLGFGHQPRYVMNVSCEMADPRRCLGKCKPIPYTFEVMTNVTETGNGCQWRSKKITVMAACSPCHV